MNLLRILQLCGLRKDQVVKTIPQLVLEFLLTKHGSGIGMPHERSLRSKLGVFAIRFNGPPLELKGADIDFWLSGPKGEGCLGLANARSRKNYRDAVTQFTRWLSARHYLPRDWSEMDAVTIPRHKPGEIVVIKPSDMIKFMAAVPEKLRAAFALIAFGGLRTQEVIVTEEIEQSKRLLYWTDIHFGSKEIYVPIAVAKTGADRLIPIQQNLFEWLERYKQDVGPVCPIRGALNIMADAKRAAGIPAGRWESHNFLRNSCLSSWLAITKNRALIAEWGGTSVGVLKRSYRRPVDEAQARAWFEIRPEAEKLVIEVKVDDVLLTPNFHPS